MAKKSYTIRGKVIDEKTEKGIPDLRVEAWDKDLFFDDFLDHRETDEQGQFQMEFTSIQFQEWFADRRPDLFFKIYHNDEEIHSTRESIHWNFDNADEIITIPINWEFKERYLVAGYVRTEDGRPVPGFLVEAFDRKVGKETLLGEAKTGDYGFYEIDYTDKATELLKNQHADLFVRAYGSKNQKIAESVVLINAPKDARVNLTVPNDTYRGPSEYEVLDEAIRRLVEPDPETFNNFEKDDFEYIAAKLKLRLAKVKRYIHAWKLMWDAGEYKKDHDIPAAAFYGVIRDDDLPELAILVNQSKQSLKQSLEQAVASNTIPIGLKEQIDTLIDALKEIAVAIAEEEPDNQDAYSVKRLIANLEDLTDDLKRKFVRTHTLYEGGIETFWDRLIEVDNEFEKHIQPLKELFNLSELSRQNLSLINALHKDITDETNTDLNKVSDLARKDLAAWKEYITDNDIKLPQKENGEQYTEQEYAEELTGTFKRAFPMVDFVHTAQSTSSPSTELIEFFEKNEDFDLGKISLERFSVEKKLNKIPEEVKIELHGWQRLYKLLPANTERSHKVITLKKAGIRSALDIVRMGHEEFTKRWIEAHSNGNTADEETLMRESKEIMHQARITFTLAGTVGLSYSDTTGQIAFVPRSHSFDDSDLSEEESEHIVPIAANWTTLFGSPNHCECPHCQSVYSPAAYLHMLYKLLKEPAKDQLNQRRPDIGKIAFTCKNTETKLPYIDLINEILENLVVAEENREWNLQTTQTEEDLIFSPENINVHAYIELARQQYPWSLPWDKWFQEGRRYLEHMKISLHQLIEAFKEPNIDGGNIDHNAHRIDQITKAECVRDILGVNERAYQLIINLDRNKENIITEHWKWFDLKKTGNNIPGNDTGVGYLQAVGYLEVCMQCMGLTDAAVSESKTEIYDEAFELMQEILSVQYIQDSNSSQDIFIDFGEHACDYSKAKIENITKDTLERLARFERLRRALGWRPHELHFAMKVFKQKSDFDTDDINAELLTNLSHVLRIKKQEEALPVIEILSWWGLLETGAGLKPDIVKGRPEREHPDEKSLYKRAFLNPSILGNPQDSTNQRWAVFELNADKSELKNKGQKISDHITVISAALGISENNLQQLIEKDFQILGSIEDELSLANLSRLYRVVSLSGYLSITIDEYLLARRLIPVNPFEEEANKPTKTENTILFIESVREIMDSSFSLHELAYLWQDYVNNEKERVAVEDWISQSLKSIKKEIKNIAAEYQIKDDPTGEIVQQILLTLFDDEDAKVLFHIINDDFPSTNPPTEEERKLFLDDHLIEFIDQECINEIKKEFVDNRPEEDKIWSAFSDLTLISFNEYLIKNKSLKYLTQFIVQSFAVEAPVANTLLKNILKFNVQPEVSLLDGFIEWAVADKNDNEEISDEVTRLHLLRLQKVATLVEKWEFSNEEIIYLNQFKKYFHNFDWNLIPPSGDKDSTPIFEQWQSIQSYITVRDRLSIEKNDVIGLLEKAHLDKGEDVINELAQLLNINKEELKKIADRLDYLENNDSWKLRNEVLRNGKTVLVLLNLVDILKRCGCSFDAINYWVGDDSHRLDLRFPDDEDEGLEELLNYKEEIVAQIKSAIKAQVSPEQWLEIAGRFQDELRILQRDCLLDLVMHRAEKGDLDLGLHKNFLTLDDIYEKLLIDVQMSSCMETSRIKQAISSLQLFIQRIKMGLEPDLTLADLDENIQNEWEWKKNYRVWEAHTKVFLYPENWLRPELRDNKTPFFKGLEDELMQSEISEESVEKAFKNYLRKLDEVANLQMMAFLTDEQGVFHLIGRTREKPNIYYYRQQTVEGIWTPWEKLDVDIASDHLVLVQYRDALYLFWPLFKEGIRKMGKDNPHDKKNDKKNYRPYYEIRMAWSKYEGGRWTPRKSTKESIEFLYDWEYQEIVEDPRTLLKFRFDIEGDELFVKAYAWAGKREEKKFYDWDDTELDNFFNNLKQELNSVELPDDANPPYPLIFDANKNLFRHRIDIAKIIVNSVLYASSGITKGVKQIQDIEVFNYYYEHPHTKNPNYPHSKTKNLINELKLVYDPRTEAGFEELFNFETLTYYYLTAPNEKFVLGKQQNEELFEFGSFRFDGCNFSSKSKGILGEGKLFAPLGEYHKKFKLPKKTIPNAEMVSGVSGLFFISSNTKLLSSVDRNFEVLNSNWYYRTSLDQELFLIRSGSILQTAIRTFLIRDEEGASEYNILSHYHPFACEFRKKLLFNYGEKPIKKFDLLLTLENQQIDDNSWSLAEYGPTENVANPGFKEKVEFNTNSPYGFYNWEVFFHIPLTIATRFSQLRQYEKAHKWFHYIFNPTVSNQSTNGQNNHADNSWDQIKQYWNVLPLHDHGRPNSIIKLMELISKADLSPEEEELKNKLLAQQSNLEKDPFQPHRLARMRLGAYQKMVVMKYMDNLIAWGDDLFSRDSIESINEATQLYVLAARILGLRPKMIPYTDRSLPEQKAIRHLQQDFFEYEVVEAQLLVPDSNSLFSHDSINHYNTLADIITHLLSAGVAGNGHHSEPAETLQNENPAFCTPFNEHLLKYWDRVADRLFKIRNCRNIEGQLRELPLFEPPIDPGLLVQAQGLGVEIDELLSDLYAPLPPYRFKAMLQKAYEFCNDVRGLGGALLSALEKKDAEELSLLRAAHEKHMLELAEFIKEEQIKELQENLKSSQVSLEMAELRFDYYKSRPFENRNEKAHVSKLNTAQDFQLAGQIVSVAASLSYLLPQIKVSAFPPGAGAEQGGLNIGGSLQAVSTFLSMLGGIYSHEANMHSIQGGRERRMDDWKFQAQQASKEIKQIQKQILATEIRIAIAEQDLSNHQKQQEHAEEIETFMKSKFTNKELYQWMVSQISAIYFQSYQMARDLAKKAQKCFSHELADDNISFITNGHWDNLKKGLLAGEKLQLDLRRMEEAYMRQNTRELEMTKSISLKALDPLQLHTLRYTGSCIIDIPEILFDLDYPGHYYRRIKSLSISIPAVVGPYSGVNCTLTLQSSEIRKEARQGEEYLYPDPPGHTNRIALSSGQNDSGLFELNHNDERYLPFEYRGVVSRWKLEFPGKFEQFDRSTITDVIFQMRYTARFDDAFKNIVNEAIVNTYNAFREEVPKGMAQQLDIRREFPDLWHQFIEGSNENGNHELKLEINKDHFPYLIQPFDIEVTHVSFYCELEKHQSSGDTIALNFGEGSEPIPLSDDGLKDGQFFKAVNVDIEDFGISEKSTIMVDTNNFSADKLKELIIVLHYSIKKEND